MLVLAIAAGVLLATLIQSALTVIIMKFRAASQLKMLQARLAELKVREDEAAD